MDVAGDRIESKFDIATSLFVLPPDAKVMPVPELSARVRAAIGPVSPGQFVLTRPGFRVTSRLIPGPLADLLGEFRAPTLLTQGILRFAQANQHDPFETLELAFDALVSLVEARFLVPETSRDVDALTPEFGAGQAYARFEIDRLIRALEDSEVYRARCADGTFVALKVARGDRPGMAERIAIEAEVLGRLGGVDSPAFLETGSERDRLYIAMEWCDGVTIATAAQRLRATRDRQRLHDLVGRMFAAYARLHRQGVLHGDVHPGNCLVTDEGRVVILDFGNARAIATGETVDPWRTGIPHFYDPQMAASVLAGQVPPAVTPQSEQYALAAMAYLLLTGAQRIAVPAVQAEMLQRIVARPILPFAAQGVRAWPQVEVVIGRALSHDPADRFPDLDAFSAAFQAAELPTELPEPWPASAQESLDAAIGAVRTLAPAADAFRNAWFALRAAVVREDAELLAAASILTRRSGTGWEAHLLAALVAQAGSDSRSEERAIRDFLDVEGDLQDGRAACNAILAAVPILKGSLSRTPTTSALAEWASHRLDQLTCARWTGGVEAIPEPVLIHLELSLCSAGAIAVSADLQDRIDSLLDDPNCSPWFWALAHDLFADQRYADRARAAERPPGPFERGFALLRLHQMDGDPGWVTSAREVVAGSADAELSAIDRALLMVELAAPELAVRPPWVSPNGPFRD